MSGVSEREGERGSGRARQWLLPTGEWLVGGDVPEGVSGVNNRECVREQEKKGWAK